MWFTAITKMNKMFFLWYCLNRSITTIVPLKVDWYIKSFLWWRPKKWCPDLNSMTLCILFFVHIVVCYHKSVLYNFINIHYHIIGIHIQQNRKRLVKFINNYYCQIIILHLVITCTTVVVYISIPLIVCIYTLSWLVL